VVISEHHSSEDGYLPSPFVFGASPFRAARDVSQLRESGLYAVVTPEECLALAATLDPLAALTVKPLVAGLDSDLGWASLELFVDRVAPALA
jgi:hypothetical protein